MLKKVMFTIFILFTISCKNDGYTEFKLIDKDHNGIYIESDINSLHLIRNLEFILKKYKVNYVKKANKIYVREDVFYDKEYMKNIGKKAQDSSWMQQNRSYHTMQIL